MIFESELIKLLESDKSLFSILKAVETLNLNDCWIAAGIIRNKVWDSLHSMQSETNDIDVIYFDENETSIQAEKILEAKLNIIIPNLPWSVKNQARMHTKNNLPPYRCSFDGVANFPETPTAIAARIKQNKIEIMAPYGLQDLYTFQVRPTPNFTKNSTMHNVYLNRIQEKNWRHTWDKLQIIT
ncbi:nucleotidyltransferase family protein [Solibacillus daqui]|uniref:nucleotidyltransferase family protein n=1 Tax=Solibacillus daqui TaxID=2912187 RepID=UPI0023666CF9|nr:nucleotidyltransferase family protein [Solibacillus daqui]